MRIAIIAPLAKPVPPRGYGGIERVVHEFSEGLVRAGHQVTLFARTGSKSSGTLVEIDPKQGEITGLHSAKDFLIEEPIVPTVEAWLKENSVDVIHDWSLLYLLQQRRPGIAPMVLSSCIPPPPGKWQNLVAAGSAHAKLFGNETPYVHYGLDFSRVEPLPKATGPLAHIAKISPSKAQHRAILAAMMAKREVNIVGNIEHQRYYNFVIRPLVALTKYAQYVGEAPGTASALKDSLGLIQTPSWFEVLPLVGIEAAALGRPMIGWRSGGVPEEIEEGRNGFVVDSLSSLADAMEKVRSIDPRECRAFAQERFGLDVMIANYLRIYERVIAGETWTSTVAE